MGLATVSCQHTDQYALPHLCLPWTNYLGLTFGRVLGCNQAVAEHLQKTGPGRMECLQGLHRPR